MNAKIKLYVKFVLQHTDDKNCAVQRFAEKSTYEEIVVELPPNFVDILNAFDKGRTNLKVTVSGSREILPGEDVSEL